MASQSWIVWDELWELVEPLLPRRERRFRHPGRKRLPDREALSGILFVLHTGVAWRHLPLELGFGSGITCWRRLDEWQRAGCVGAVARAAVVPAACLGRDRVVARDRRLEPDPGEKGGRYRWVVERTFAWLQRMKRLHVLYDRRADIHEAFLALGCCLICCRRLTTSI